MTIKKCDRCGAEITEKHQNIFDRINDTLNDMLGGDKTTYEIKKYVDHMAYDVDLCEDCQKSFNEWLDGGLTI